MPAKLLNHFTEEERAQGGGVPFPYTRLRQLKTKEEQRSGVERYNFQSKSSQHQ